LPSLLFRLLQLSRRLWVTAALYSALGLAAALAAAQFGHLVPSDFPLKLGSDAVDDILTILASSMLAVATFSLTTLVTAYTAVVSNISPRAGPLIVADGPVRSSLATFVGAFIYSIVGIIALHTEYYGSEGRVILFFVTLLVLCLVIAAMLRWIGQLSSLGQARDIISRVAAAASHALASRPIMLAHCAKDELSPKDARVLVAERVGYVQNIDLEGLDGIAQKEGFTVRLAVLPGSFVNAATPLLWLEGPELSTRCAAALRGKITVGSHRTFEQDPRYGLTVLGEIAARGLSSGVNDAGLAREVASQAAALFAEYGEAATAKAQPCQNVVLPRLDPYGLLCDVFEPIARFGAGDPTLHGQLQEALLALSVSRDPRLSTAAGRLSDLALSYAKDRLARREDIRAAVEAAQPVRRRASQVRRRSFRSASTS
jgi:uncharacterized membrane protein